MCVCEPDPARTHTLSALRFLLYDSNSSWESNRACFRVKSSSTQTNRRREPVLAVSMQLAAPLNEENSPAPCFTRAAGACRVRCGVFTHFCRGLAAFLRRVLRARSFRRCLHRTQAEFNFRFSYLLPVLGPGT